MNKKGNVPLLGLRVKCSQRDERGILCNKTCWVSHIVDRCIRSAMAEEVNDLCRRILFGSRDRMWMLVDGAFLKLYCDGGGGINGPGEKKEKL